MAARSALSTSDGCCGMAPRNQANLPFKLVPAVVASYQRRQRIVMFPHGATDAASECVRADLDVNECLHRIIDAAMALPGARQSNLQLRDVRWGGLKIAAQHG